MFKRLIVRYVKNRIIEGLNNLLEKNKGNVEIVCNMITQWSNRLQIVIEQLDKISSRCADGHLEDSEVNDSIKEIETIVREW